MSALPVIARDRLRGRLLPILHTALAAVGAWLLAGLLVTESHPAFAAIAAIVTVGMTSGQRGERAVQLTGGVVLGICIADLIAQVIGAGPLQLGVLVVFAMLAAVLLGGSEMVIVESAVSAILLVTSSAGAFTSDRILEAMIGGASALAVGMVVFPPDPALAPGRAGQALFAALGGALERVAAGLRQRDPEAAELALGQARAIDPLVAEVQLSIAAGREAARLSPLSNARTQLDRYDRSLTQLDFAVRNTRVLARAALRLVRAGAEPAGLDEAIGRLGGAVWELAGAYDDPRRAGAARRLATEAAIHATEIDESRAHAELVGTLRSTAADLIRAADLISDEPVEQPTEELLAVQI